MHLKIIKPEKIILDQEVDKVIAEGLDGAFCLKPRHIDFVSALKPGILVYESDVKEYYMAIDEGILVKCGQDVMVSVLNAIAATKLAELDKTVRDVFYKSEELNKATEFAMKSMEAELLLHFIEINK
ncbi:MAG: F0F1 ATP synthase subunit epsilon [Bacteroidetes bacterium]|nr:F0F1 ATP synthase subunit epsilon [Bacteroidota bacterium]